jgi:predicted amidophosphoribosyltransferase
MGLLALVLPERCAICARPGAALCTRCRDALVPLRPPVCERCGSPGPWPVRRCAECSGRRLAFARARSAIVYDASARTFVRVWKEYGRARLAREAAALVAELVPRPAVDVLVHVPGDRERALERGRIAPAALAEELARVWELPAADLLRRTRSLRRQRGLGLAERRRNVRGSVAARGEAPRRVCVVDDVYTSGATGNECASALRRAGSGHVEVVTLTRAVR